jgi:hypothetical protein
MNPRIIIFALVALMLIGFPAYVFLDEKVSGGIKDKGDHLEVSLKQISSFEMDQNTGTDADVPEEYRKLSGKRVVLEGELWSPNNSSSEVPEIELVYSIAKCCFSGPPKKQHFVLCRPAEGKSIDFYQGLVRVTGVLHVKVEHNEGKVTRVYKLDVEKVEPV